MPTYETREFTVEQLNELEIAVGARCVVEDEIVDHTRWSVVHRAVFLFEGEFYEVNYEDPATESQEADTWGTYGGPVTARRMLAEQVMVTKYVPVPTNEPEPSPEEKASADAALDRLLDEAWGDS